MRQCIPQGALDPQSPQARVISDLGIVSTIVIVTGAILYAHFRFRGGGSEPEAKRFAGSNKKESLLPPLSEARQLGRLIARAVGRQAIQDGQAQVTDEDSLGRELQTNIWEPVMSRTNANDWLTRRTS